jgi:N-acetylmuramoyl-L-alanine amidase
MSMNYARTSSVDVAQLVHNKIAKFAKMHKKHIEKAAFVVLKSPDIPSILVETGFISNPGEAKKLRDPAYQKRMAKAVAEGLLEHFWTRPPPGTLVAKLKESGQLPKGMEREYKVVAGDSLSRIAQRNGVSLGALRSANKLKSDRIRVGQVLRIPAG